MDKYPPCKYAAFTAVLVAILFTLMQWAGLEITVEGSTNLLIAWGVVALCHAVEWHAKQRR